MIQRLSLFVLGLFSFQAGFAEIGDGDALSRLVTAAGEVESIEHDNETR